MRSGAQSQANSTGFFSQMSKQEPGSQSETTAQTKADAKKKQPDVAPYIYTTSFNKNQDLLFCGGAGKNEMRIFDWESGNIVAMISNLPRAIICGAQAHNQPRFAFGAADSRVRIFDIVEGATQSQMSRAPSSTYSQSQRSGR